MSGTRRWLLMLGSNLADDRRVHAALAALAQLGPVRRHGTVAHLPPRSGKGAWYYNVLAVLDSPLDASALRTELGAIEARLGRVRNGAAPVAIDIDVLAGERDGAWIADPHALEKREFEDGPAPQLLQACGLQVRPR